MKALIRTKHFFVITLVVSFFALCTNIVNAETSMPTLTKQDQVTKAKISKQDKEKFVEKTKLLQMPFITNQGQTDLNIEFYANTFGGTVSVTKEGEIVYSLPKVEESSSQSTQLDETPLVNPDDAIANKPVINKTLLLKEILVGRNNNTVSGEEPSVTKANCFKGKDPSKWKSNIPTYNMVSLGEVYDGVGLKLKAYSNNVEKLFYVKPGTDPSAINIRLEGSKKLSISENGQLEADTELGIVKFTRPVAYQEIEGEKVKVAVAYNLRQSGQNSNTYAKNLQLATSNQQFIYGFNVEDYDRSRELIIDPLLASTFTDDDGLSISNGGALSPDGSGNVYVTGHGDGDYHISILDSELKTLFASTVIGGSGGEQGQSQSHSLAFDSNGDVFVVGMTRSSDFPFPASSYDQNRNGQDDVFVCKLKGDLSVLLASTFLGGTDFDGDSGVAIDSNDNVFVVGRTRSADFPTEPDPPDSNGPYDSDINGNIDIFISKFNNTLTALSASTFFGGTYEDDSADIIIDGFDKVYIVGRTFSGNFTTTVGAFDRIPTGGSTDRFANTVDGIISKFDSNLSALEASTFLGDSIVHSIVLNNNGTIYVAGQAGTSFPITPGAYEDGRGAFVTNLKPDLTGPLLASTQIGDTYSLSDGVSVAIDSNGDVYVGGVVTDTTNGYHFPNPHGAYDRVIEHGGSDIFVSKLKGDLTDLLASTFLGGSSWEPLSNIFLDSSDNVYIVGRTGSADFPIIPGAYDTTRNGQSVSFIAKLSGDLKLISDRDNDGISDGTDNCPDTPNTDQLDSDGDGIGDVCDDCVNVSNTDQSDNDSDGIGDVCDNCPTDYNPDQLDSDADGVADACDNCPNISNPDQVDLDGDGIGEVCDDDDDDGIDNPSDNCKNDPNPGQVDLDGDTVGDVCDNCPNTVNSGQSDTDGDGVGNACDNCFDVTNPDQVDSNNDGIGDACEPDSDNDGIFDYEDNCPQTANTDQADVDGDGIGDVCDNCPSEINPGQENLDGDIHGDACDSCPSIAGDIMLDTDLDGIGEACDNCPDVANFDQIDADNDGIGDGCDNCVNSSNSDQTDTDGDGVGDVCEADTDEDGIIDDDDNCINTPNPEQVDADNDGIGDLCDNCPFVANHGQEDRNENGIGDACDYDDSDDDGVPDSDDNCPDTPKWATDAGLVDEFGCVDCLLLEVYVDSQCPPDANWRNHGKYVSCVSDIVGFLADLGQISDECAGSITSARAQSDVGKPQKGK